VTSAQVSNDSKRSLPEAEALARHHGTRFAAGAGVPEQKSVQPIRTPRPLTLVAAAALGGALLALGRRGRGGALARFAGLALISVASEPILRERVRRAGARRRALSAHSSIEIARPVSDVFRFFKDFENFPRIVASIRSVVDYEDGRSHWEVYTPGGETLEFDAVVTKYVPNSVIAWASVPGSPVETTVLARFTPLTPSTMRLDVDVSYCVVNTGLGDAVRALVAPRSATQLVNGLERARFYLESMSERSPALRDDGESPAHAG
jgi:uncharacterized membrane protein